MADRSPVEESTSDLVHAATTLLTRHQVRKTAQQLSVSERQLRNLFTKTVGISPKRFASVDRVRTVLSHAHRHRGARLAVESGYYDQSHMSAEFRSTMRVPLGSYLAGDLPPSDSC
jgi:transcriptional regulator GlxA family with amidase domain